MKGQVEALIGVMIVLIIGIAVAVPTITDTVNQATQSVAITNEQIAGVNATTDTLAYPRLVSSVTIYNATGGSVAITSGNYTVDATNGHITWTTLNNTLYTAPQFVNYTGHYTAYQTSGTTRTLLGVLPLLVVIAIVLVVVAWMKLK